MDNYVVTLETARRLWQAGFKLPYTAFYYSAEGIDDNWRLYYNSMEYETSPDDLLAPTAQEIADQLPTHLDEKDGIYPLVLQAMPTYLDNAPGYYAEYVRFGSPKMQAIGPTLAEALAALWLRLQETK